MDSLPPLNALRCFDVVGRLGSVTEAAAELCVTPAAVSRQIRQLEQHFGIRLFERQHRRIVLTDAGRTYHGEIAQHFAGLHRASTALTASLKRRRPFVIKAPHSIAMRWLLPRLSSFHRRFPGVDVKLHTSVAPPDFKSEAVDAAICLGDGRWKGWKSYKVMVNELTPVCTPEKAARLRKPRDLMNEVLLHTLARPDYWEIWLRAAGATRVDVSHGLQYESSALAYEAALAGYGVAIAQKPLVEKELAEGKLVAPFDLCVDLGDVSYYFVLPEADYQHRSKELDTFRGWVASFGI
ncbi:LysR substrate-binding domain-containing protein [Pseudomonadota bacterium AL_CKDN230030165-1A_HGKHYDSX7]